MLFLNFVNLSIPIFDSILLSLTEVKIKWQKVSALAKSQQRLHPRQLCPIFKALPFTPPPKKSDLWDISGTLGLSDHSSDRKWDKKLSCEVKK